MQKNGVSTVASFEQNYELSKFKKRNSKRLPTLSIKNIILQGKIILQRGNETILLFGLLCQL